MVVGLLEVGGRGAFQGRFGRILGSFWAPFLSTFGFIFGAKIKEDFLYVFGSVWVSVWVPLGLQSGSIWELGGRSRRKRDTCKKLVLLKENNVFGGSGGSSAHPN